MRAILAALMLLSVPALAGRVRVRGYVKPKSGTYAMPHVRTSPDSRKANNWSSKGNINPYTGKKGTK